MFHAARICAVCLLASLAVGRVASAEVDAGCADDAGTCEDAGIDGGGEVPLACDGALCDTTNGASCSTAGKPVNLAWLAVVVVAFVFPILRRHHRPLGGSGRHECHRYLPAAKWQVLSSSFSKVRGRHIPAPRIIANLEISNPIPSDHPHPHTGCSDR